MMFSPFRFLCITGFFAIFSSTVSKNPVLPLYAAHLGGGPAGVGMVASVSALAGIIASIPAGILSDRLGRKRVLIFSAAIFSTAPFLYLAVENIWQLAAVRFYHGFATALFIPVSMALVSDLFYRERGEKMGWFSTSTLAGRFLAPMTGGAILGAMVFDPGLGYRTVYLLCGAAGMAVFIFTLMLPFPHGKEIRGKGWGDTIHAFRETISLRGILATSMVEAAILFAYGTFETFLPLYSLRSGLSAYEIGIILSAQIITLALTKPALGRFSDRHGRKQQVFAGALSGAACVAGFSFFSSFLSFLVLSILFGLSLSAVTSASSALIADISREETHGSAMGILGSIMDIGHTTGPLVSGIIVSLYGYGACFTGAAMVLVLASAIFRLSIMKSGS